jgi:hypothetical protein
MLRFFGDLSGSGRDVAEEPVPYAGPPRRRGLTDQLRQFQPPGARLRRQRAEHGLLLRGLQQPDGGAVRRVACSAGRVGGHEGAGRAEPDGAARHVAAARRGRARPGHGALQRVLPGQPRRCAGDHRARQLLPHPARQGRRHQGCPARHRRAAQRDDRGTEVAGALGVRKIVDLDEEGFYQGRLPVWRCSLSCLSACTIVASGASPADSSYYSNRNNAFVDSNDRMLFCSGLLLTANNALLLLDPTVRSPFAPQIYRLAEKARSIR